MNPTILGFFRKEIAQVLRDPRMRVALFLMPVVQMTIFGLAIRTESRNIRLAASYPPEDSMTRRIVERAWASGWFVPAEPDNGDPYDWVHADKADAVLVAPPGGLLHAAGRDEGRLQALVDASNAVRARSIENYLKIIIAEVAAEKTDAPPNISFSVRMLYNPSMETVVFMVPGVMCMILCIVTIILTSMSMAREKELGTFETLISAPVANWEILLGKTLPFILLGMIDVPLVITVAVWGFGVPMRGPHWELALAALVFVCMTVSAGILISTFARNQQQAMMGGFIFLFPAIQLSGIIFPVENMPPAIAWVGALNPLRYFVTLLRNIMLKGGDPRVFWSNLAVLTVMCLLTMTVTIKRFRQTLN